MPRPAVRLSDLVKWYEVNGEPGADPVLVDEDHRPVVDLDTSEHNGKPALVVQITWG